jgi:hypothetical protein
MGFATIAITLDASGAERPLPRDGALDICGMFTPRNVGRCDTRVTYF